MKSHWTNEADQGTTAIFLMLSLSWSSSIEFQEYTLKKRVLWFLFTHNQIGNQWTVGPWTALIWTAGLKWCCFLYIRSKNPPKIKDAVDSRGDEHLPCLFYGDLNILTYICPWFFTSVYILGSKMTQEKALYFHFCHATDTDFCTGLLVTITIIAWPCIVLRLFWRITVKKNI